MIQNNNISKVEVRKGYYESGALWYETPYVNGKIHGVEKHYDSDKLNIDCLALYEKGHKAASVKFSI